MLSKLPHPNVFCRWMSSLQASQSSWNNRCLDFRNFCNLNMHVCGEASHKRVQAVLDIQSSVNNPQNAVSKLISICEEIAQEEEGKGRLDRFFVSLI